MAPKRKQKEDREDKNKTKKGKVEEKPEETKKVDGEDDFSSDATTKDGKKWNLKVLSWNVDGLRAWLKKDGLSMFEKESPDIVCLQETKCSEVKLPPEAKTVEGYHSYFISAKTEGYSGVALYSKEKPIDVTYGFGDATHDDEGRVITAEFPNFYLVTTYVPNAGRKLVTLDKRMDWDPKFRKHLKDLDAKKPVIMCGDLNVAHSEIDLANPKSNKKNAGFTQEERDGFTKLLSTGFVDSFRQLYPKKEKQYTFWTYIGNCRAKNVGWRLDYFVLSKRLVPQLCDNLIRTSLYGSDHCPITLLMHF
ncbi:hypothetical protein Pcinc_007919 [Petrolisthes cinctipes]|uniref:DNA repair nuclease/redox regulator APEX1 n=1 Tax=Petrolisthes cinctipes TaxID=88211 RepID=A0AAE1KY37_PETCI|nr:hypothetical protein Pcinc_007919 [Petrolisthes cinctipes]